MLDKYNIFYKKCQIQKNGKKFIPVFLGYILKLTAYGLKVERQRHGNGSLEKCYAFLLID